jgi:hypothetical protein
MPLPLVKQFSLNFPAAFRDEAFEFFCVTLRRSETASDRIHSSKEKTKPQKTENPPGAGSQ